MDNDYFNSGMRWLRADFHLHTKADKEFQYSGSDSDFNRLYVERLEAESVSIGVITNHNKFDREEYKALRKDAKKKNIWLLPGVELSVNDGANGVHCLIVFDKDKWLGTDDDFINQFLTSVFEGVPNRENENVSCNCNLETILNKLDNHRKDGRDSFVILAHVNQSKGFFKELDGGRIKTIANKELFKKSVLGFQKLTDRDTESNCKIWFGGWMPAKVQGSDCKSIDFVGKVRVSGDIDLKTYIKIGDFNFDALKYALLDKEHRVAEKYQTTAKTYLQSISFSGGKLDGQTIKFSPDLNNFIGIRGSGKSSVLEILRYVLGIELTDAVADKNYKNELVSYILGSGGKATLEFRGIDGKDYRIEKILGQTPSLYSNNNERLECSLNAVIDIPMYFGQKDLSNKKDSFESELINRMTGTHLDDYRREVKEQEQNVRNWLIELQKLDSATDRIPELEKTIKDAQQKLTFFKENGVEEKLRIQTQYEHDVNTLNTKIGKVVEFKYSLSEALSNKELWAEIKGSKDNTDIFDSVNSLLGEGKLISDVINNEVQKLDILLEKLNSELNRLNAKVDSMKEEFAKIKRELNSDTVNPDEFLKINRLLSESNQKLTELKEVEKQREDLRSNLLAALDSLNESWRKEYLALKTNVNRVSSSSANLKIEVEFKGRRNEFATHFKNLVKGSNLREATIQRVVDKYKDYIEIYKNWDDFKKLIAESAFSYVSDKINNDLADLLTYKVGNKVTIKYKGKDLSRHSLGQRASALILFLLAQKETGILIIDQPEDDLDNQTIYDEVIKEIVKLKTDMQFIFATHNANIPVLGDSEKVVACNFEDSSKIEIVQGSIDTPAIQKSIVSIMEGGEEAFNRRKDIYNIWRIK